jgi:hypothetical protein
MQIRSSNLNANSLIQADIDTNIDIVFDIASRDDSDSDAYCVDESNANEKRRQKRRCKMDRIRMVRELSMDEFRHCPGKVTYHPKHELLPRSAFRPGCKQCIACNSLEVQRKRNRKLKQLKLCHVQDASVLVEPLAAAAAVDRSPVKQHAFLPYMQLPPGLAIATSAVTPRYTGSAVMSAHADVYHDQLISHAQSVSVDERPRPQEFEVTIPHAQAALTDSGIHVAEEDRRNTSNTFARGQWCQPRRLTFDRDSDSESAESDSDGAREQCHDMTNTRSSLPSNATATTTRAPIGTAAGTSTAFVANFRIPHSPFLSSVRLCRWIDWVQSTFASSFCNASLPSYFGSDHTVIDVHVAVNVEARVEQSLPAHMWRIAFTTFLRTNSRTCVSDLIQHVLHHMRLSDVDRAAYSLFPFRQAYHASWLRTLMPEQSWHHLSNTTSSLVEHCLFRDRPNRVFVVLKYFPQKSDMLWRIG